MVLQIELTVFVLLALMMALLFFVCGKKTFRFLLSLICTAIVLLSVIVPLITKGYDPVLVSFIGAIPILILVIYLTEGFTVLSHLSIGITIINFAVISLLAHFSIVFAHLSGAVSDVATTVGGQLGIDLPKLLVAGIMLGTLGVLIEMIVTQVATVIELVVSNPNSDKQQIYQQAYKVGVIHLGSIINTLFLIYAGIALPLLIVFAQLQGSLGNVLGYEPLSSEIIRTLVSSIGLIIAMPVSTYLATYWLKRKAN